MTNQEKKQEYIRLRQSGMTKDQAFAAIQNKKTPGLADKITDFVGARGIADTFGSEIAQRMAPTQEEKNIISASAPTVKQTAGSALQTGSIFLPVGGMANAITAGARGLGLTTRVSALGKIGAGAAAGFAFDAGANMQANQPVRPGVGTALGAAIPAAGVAINVAGRAAQKVLPKLLSYTSDVPEKAFQQMLERRDPVVKAIKAGTTGQQALTDTQGAVRQLRTTLSQEWDDGIRSVIDQYQGQRIGLSTKEADLLARVADDFPVELPQNIKNMSVKEATDLLKSVNELYSKRAVKEAAQGINVRSFKDQFYKKVIASFGGDKGPLAQVYKNYSAKKGVLDAANDIVRAYSTGKPIQQSTALGRLTALFSENKGAYLDAILDLERTTGKDLMSKITAAQFVAKLPRGTAAMTASGTLRQSKSALDKAIDLLILPLSSPRSAGLIARVLSKAKSPTITTPGDMFLQSKAGQAALDYAKTAQPGLSTKPIKIHPDDSAALTDFIDIVRQAGTDPKKLADVPESRFVGAERIFTRLGQSLDKPIQDLARIAEDILSGKIDASVLYRTGRDFK